MSRRPNRPLTAGLSKARELMDRQYAGPLRIERLASEAGLSPFHFIRAFCEAFGQTLHQYLRDKRIERAKELYRAQQ